jgi:ubiquinone/menaquinone biosynthesis C-methylase UbiE
LGNLLDIGTGTGRMIELLGPRATTALGIDRSPEMLRLARGRIEAEGLAHARSAPWRHVCPAAGG